MPQMVPLASQLNETFFHFHGALAQVAPPAGNNTPTTTTASPPPSGGSGAPTGSGSMLQFLLPILIFVAFYFFLIRPQQKKARELNSKLKKGDKVFTNSGIIGTIVTLGEKRATLEIATGVKMEILRSAIGGLDEGDAPKKSESSPAVVEAKK